MSRSTDRRQFAGDTYEDQMLSGDLDDDDESDRVTCRRCNTGGLHWQEIVKGDGTPGHALFNERNRKHECAGPDLDGFTKEE